MTSDDNSGGPSFNATASSKRPSSSNQGDDGHPHSTSSSKRSRPNDHDEQQQQQRILLHHETKTTSESVVVLKKPNKAEGGGGVVTFAGVLPDLQSKSPKVVKKAEQQQQPSMGGITTNSTKQQQQRARWKTHQMAEDYMDLVGNMMYPGIQMGPYGGGGLFTMENQCSVPLERMTSLGYLTSPLRRPTVVERWSPYEIAMFEASLTIHGKDFHKVQQLLQQDDSNKSTKDIVEFYYIWKKTRHYKAWKEQYVSDYDSSSSEENQEHPHHHHHHEVINEGSHGNVRRRNKK